MWGGNALMLPLGAPRLHGSRLRSGRPLQLTYWRNAASYSTRKHSVRTVAELRTKGQRYQAEQLTLKQSLGEGSFGEVFEVRHAESCVLFSTLPCGFLNHEHDRF
jgi:hypothetical protein